MNKKVSFLFICLFFWASFCLAYEDGTTIFFQNGFFHRPIARYTGSHMCHIAIVLHQNGKEYVYESTLRGVQKTPLNIFLTKVIHRQKWNKRLKVYYVKPKIPYTKNELIKMKTYANSQLGRLYSLRGWWVNREVIGMHCSQYVGNIIGQTGRITSMRWKESPISLYRKLTK